MKEVWGYSHARLPEAWIGEFPTRDAAIAEGRKQHAGGPFWVIRGLARSPDYFMPMAEDILDVVKDAAEDDLIDRGDWESPDDDALGELDAFLTLWARKYLEVPGWMTIGKPERVAAAREDA